MNTDSIRLPRTIYVGFADFGRLGLGSAGDFVTDMEDAADQLAELMDERHLPRMFRMDFDAETNAVEAVNEVTEEVMAIIERRMTQRGLNAA